MITDIVVTRNMPTSYKDSFMNAIRGSPISSQNDLTTFLEITITHCQYICFFLFFTKHPPPLSSNLNLNTPFQQSLVFLRNTTEPP
jgi:hypothetical protein